MSPRFVVGMTLMGGALLARPLHADSLSPPDASQGALAPCTSGDTTACGRLYFEAGTRAFERGDFEQARLAFAAAQAQKPHPVIRYNLAVCWSRLGKPTAALRELTSVLEDQTIDRDLRLRSEHERTLAEQARVHVSFALMDPAHERVEVDGEFVPASELEHELLFDPGAHHVRIVSGAVVLLDQPLDLAPSERIELRVGQRSRSIDVVVVPVAAPAGPSAPRARPAEHVQSRLPPAWFYVATGTTAVLSGLTIWSGIDTNRAYSDYRRQLPSLTQDEADRRVQSGHARELRTNLLLAGALVSGAGTAVLGLWLVDFGGTSSQLALAPGRLELTTRF